MWWRIALLGTIGVLSMLLAPLERLLPPELDPMLLRALAVMQPLLLVLAFSALGAWAAPKVGLDAPAVRAWAERRPILPALRPQILPGLVGALAVSLVLVAFARTAGDVAEAAQAQGFAVPLVTRILYGGIVEEVLMRWGLMSLFVWVAWRLSGARAMVPDLCHWTGIALAALLFAAGHLPLLYTLVPEPTLGLTALVIAGNAAPGLLFGWLYWRKGLEAAMIAHGLAHAAAALLLLAV